MHRRATPSHPTYSSYLQNFWPMLTGPIKILKSTADKLNEEISTDELTDQAVDAYLLCLEKPKKRWVACHELTAIALGGQ